MPNQEYTARNELFEPSRFQRAVDLLTKWTSGPEPLIPSAGLLAGRGGKIIEPLYFGKQGPEPAAEPIRRDGLFLLASLTKPVTYLAGLQLVEQGLLNLHDPVVKYLPEFAPHHKEEIRVLHLFTHTSGLPDSLPDNAELRMKHSPMKAFIEGTFNTMPLFPAGTKLSYQSMGTLMVAELVQRLTGQTIHDYLKKEIFEPLGMTSSGLGSRGIDRARIIRVETTPEQQGTDWGWNSKYWQEFGAPWGGMFSTPEDYAKICQMLLNGGSLGDARILSPAAVKTMTTNRLDDLADLPEATRRTEGWGLGWRMNQPGSNDPFGNFLSPRAFGHWGATGTMVWIDPDLDGFFMLFTSAILSRSKPYLIQISNIVTSAFR
ncbi:MAG: serine hydrolase domain-containing protein [Planctomycetaceae bacterium]